MGCRLHGTNVTVDVVTLEQLLSKHFPTNLPQENKQEIITAYAVYVFSQEHCVEEGIVYLGSIASLMTLSFNQSTNNPVAVEIVTELLQTFENLTIEIYGHSYSEAQTTKNVSYAFRAAALATLVFNKAARGGIAIAVTFCEKHPECEQSWMDMAEDILRQMYNALLHPPALFLPIRAELRSYRR